MKSGLAGGGFLTVFLIAVVATIQLGTFWTVCDPRPISDACYTAMDSSHAPLMTLAVSAATIAVCATVFALTRHKVDATLLAAMAVVAPAIEYGVRLQIVDTADTPYGFATTSTVILATGGVVGVALVAVRAVRARAPKSRTPITPT